MPTYGISSYGTATGLTGDEIKNLALFTIGFPDEIDFTDLTNETVKKVNRIYTTSLFYVLSNYPWRFILKRVQLTTRTDATNTEKYKYNYVTPANMLTIRSLFYDENYNNAIKEYESYPSYINTDANTVYLWYSSIVDEDRFPQYFIDYFKYKLALDLCFNLTGDTDLLQVLKAQSDQMLISAKNIDAKQNMTRTIKASPYISIRR